MVASFFTDAYDIFSINVIARNIDIDATSQLDRYI